MSANEGSKRSSGLACERCRAQKLRCDWPSTSPDASCACDRCSRMGVLCKRNNSRRVGRPPRARLTRHEAAPLRIVDPDTTSYLPESVWLETCRNQIQWDESHTSLSQGHTAVGTTCPGSPSLTSAMADDGGLFSLLSSDVSIDRMLRNSDASSLVNTGVESYSLSAITDSSLESLDLTHHEDALGQKEDHLEDSREVGREPDKEWTRELASITASLFELAPPRSAHGKEEHTEKTSREIASSTRPTALLRSTMQHTQALSNLIARCQCNIATRSTLPSDHSTPPTSRLFVDGPTQLLLLSCYSKIFQAYRHIFAGIYCELRSGTKMTDLLCDLRVEDIVLDGDNDLKILVLMQVVTYKLNTLCTQLGVPEKHHVGVGAGNQHGGVQVGLVFHQAPPEESSLDGIMSGSGSDRCVFRGAFNSSSACMESAAAAFREELSLIRAQLGQQN